MLGSLIDWFTGGVAEINHGIESALIPPPVGVQFSTNATGGAYEHHIGKYYVDLAAAAYCHSESIALWNCYACQAYPSVTAHPVKDAKSNTHAFVAYVPDRNQIVVSFAGTDPVSITNWISDIKMVAPDDYPCEGCKAHRGFYDAYMTVQTDIRDQVADMKKAHPTASLGVTGHSLGAALAMHGALDLVNAGHVVNELYTFGCPRWGNDALRKYLEDQVDTIYRVTHHKDPVPIAVPRELGYHHSKTEVFYMHDKSITTPTICDGSGEDENCSNKEEIVNVLDHMEYLGFDFKTNYAMCKLNPGALNPEEEKKTEL